MFHKRGAAEQKAYVQYSPKICLGQAGEISTETLCFNCRTRYLAKTNITAYENHTVSFSLPAGAIFDPSMSVGPEEDVVTVLNLVVAVRLHCHAHSAPLFTMIVREAS